MGDSLPGNLCKTGINIGRHRRVALFITGSLADRRTDSPESDVDFWVLVRSLPRRQAQVVALHYVSDMSVLEIAATLGGSAEGARANVYQALKKLRAVLGRNP